MDDLIRLAYRKSCDLEIDEKNLERARAFVTALFAELPVAGYIDEDNNMNFDEFMLPGSNTRKLYEPPKSEK